jgi:hypothetical protein
MEGGDSVIGGTLDLTSMVNLNEERPALSPASFGETFANYFFDGAVASHRHPVEPTQ